VPQVVASGEGEIAALIKARAEAAGVPVVEDPRLAFLLSQVPLGDDIPPALYRAVAEVLVFVMRMELAISEQG
jgi:flagellar biosynthesis protein